MTRKSVTVPNIYIMTRKLSETFCQYNQERINEATECITTGLQDQKQVNNGVNFEDVNVDLKLSFLKPIHATWMMEKGLVSIKISKEINDDSLKNAKLK